MPYATALGLESVFRHQCFASAAQVTQNTDFIIQSNFVLDMLFTSWLPKLWVDLCVCVYKELVS